MTTLTNKSASQISSLFIMGWMLVAVIGFALAGMLFHNFPLAYFPSKPTRLGVFNLFPAIFGFFLGGIPTLLIGGFQQTLLGRYLPISRWWIVSVSLGIGLMHFLSDGFENALDLSVAVLVGGLSVGVVQWILLRPHLSSAGWWVIASIMSWYLGWVIGFALLRSGVTLYLSWIPWESYVKQHTILGGMIGVFYGSSTILLLRGLLKRKME